MSFLILRQIRLCDLCRKQELEKAYKALRLNGFESSYYYDHSHNPSLLGASSLAIKEKPTVWLKRLGFSGHCPNNIKLKGASSVQQRLKVQRENADKALRLNGV